MLASKRYEIVVYINPEKVRQICAGPDGGTIFEFDGRHRVLADGQTETIVMKLSNA
jgi:hypothetical protein